jgi:hypothetical protein
MTKRSRFENVFTGTLKILMPISGGPSPVDEGEAKKTVAVWRP